MLYVCSLAKLQETVTNTQAARVVTLLAPNYPAPTPLGISKEAHLILRLHDIEEVTEGQTVPNEDHLQELLNFIRSWNQKSPLIVHCYMGKSRSTAAAYIVMCALNPDMDESSIAAGLRRSSPAASPNKRLVSLADGILMRNGRMISAMKQIGLGDETEPAPFHFELQS